MLKSYHSYRDLKISKISQNQGISGMIYHILYDLWTFVAKLSYTNSLKLSNNARRSAAIYPRVIRFKKEFKNLDFLEKWSLQ